MANTLTNLAADAYKSADIVARELTGFIAGSTINAGSEGAAVGQNVRAHFTRSASAVDITPSMTIPQGTDQTVDTKTLTLTKQKGVQIPWTGEDVKFVDAGPGFNTIYGDQILQAMRTLVNLVEVDLAVEAYKNASRAHGTAGTTPFGSNFDEVAEVRQILADNGMPMSDQRLSLVLNTAAGTNLRQLAQLQKVNESGSGQLLRQGELLNLQGFSIKESAQVQSHTAGSLTGTIATSGAAAVGDTSITLATDAGEAIAIDAGDIVTFAGGSSYIAAADLDVAASSSGTLTIHSPGLTAAVASGTGVTVASSYTANVGLHQSALELAIRPPANPPGGDAAVDSMVIQDTRTGLAFEISAYKGFKKAMFMVGAVWGVKAWKPEGIAVLAG